MVWPRVAQGAVLLGIVVVLVDGLGVVFSFRDRAAADGRGARAAPAVPALAVRPGAICLDGWLEHGTTGRLARALERYRGVERIVLNSTGGQVAEGRGVAQLVKRRRLTTVVLRECSSACASAFRKRKC